MAHSNARRNERNLIRTDFQYNYTKDRFKGVDFTTPDGRCDDEHFAYLENLYRDKEKKNSSSLESVPGYRKIKKNFLHGGEIYGIYSQTFMVNGVKKRYLLIHKGEYLYCFLHDRRDIAEDLTPIATLATGKSCGFAYGNVFYLLDGEKILAVKSPSEVFVLGDEILTQAQKEAGMLPETTAYVPLTFSDGEAVEARNMLSGFFDVERHLDAKSLPDDTQGLFYRECRYDGTDGLEVYGMESGRRIAAIPERVFYNDEMLPVLAVAESAFEGKNITTAVIAPSVKVIGDSAFKNCGSLERVLIHGSPAIGSQAFGNCALLRYFAIKNAKGSADASAFDGCSTLTHVFAEEETASGFMARLADIAAYHANTHFIWQEEGGAVSIPCTGMGEYGISPVYGGEYEVLGDMGRFYNMETDEEDQTDGVSATVGKSCPFAQYVIRGKSLDTIPRYVFVSVYDRNGRLNTQDRMEGFRVMLPSETERVVSVWIDRRQIGEAPDENGICYVTEYSCGKLTSLRVVLDKNRGDVPVQIRVRCYSERAGGDLLGKERAYDVIRHCRLAAVFDGNVFLSGNPDFPDLVFHSVTPKGACDLPTFAPTAYLALRDTAGDVAAFAVHPLYLAIFKERSVYGVTRGARGDALHEIYEIDGWCVSPAFRGGTHTFLDEPLFLSERGVMVLKRGKAWEEGRIENRSYYIDAFLGTLWDDKPSFAEWNGYLVLLIDGKIFLGDASIAEKKNGVLAYEWYFLNGIGHYDGQSLCYHHLTYEPRVLDKKLTSLTLGGKRLCVLGEEQAVEGEVFEAIAEENGKPCGITVYYTERDGEYYLVDSRGEMAGGVFSPATMLHATDGCLYFASEDGYLFCFNNDKRGKSAIVNDSLQSVAWDEIHESYYSFDGRAYRSSLISGNVDMGVPHLLKSTVPKSLVVRAKTMPHSAFTVYVRHDGNPWKEVGYVVANRSLDYPDADRLSLDDKETVSEMLADSGRGWLSKQVMICADVFESPIGFEAFGYRYKMAGRVRNN